MVLGTRAGAAANPPIRSKVLILGAGASGISAALKLQQNNISDIKIIEATANVGGRVTHQPFGHGSMVELGANWIYGKGKNPIHRLAKRYGLKTAPSDKKKVVYFTEEGSFHQSQGEKWSKDFNVVMKKMVRIANDQVDLSSRTALELLGWQPDCPVKAAIEYFGIDWELAEPPETCSLDYAAGTVDLVSGSFPLGDEFVVDQRGFNYVLQQEAAKLANLGDADGPVFYFNTTVTRIQYDNHSVTVETTDGTIFIADYAICTFSLGVLQNKDVLFEPAFPQWKREALLSFHMTTYTKIFLNFEHAFWDNWQFALYASNKTKQGDYTVWQNLAGPKFRASPHDNILMVTTTGKESVRLEAKTDKEIEAEVLKVISKMFPGQTIPTPQQIMIPRWHSNPLFRGSYSNWALGASIQHQENMQAPLPVADHPRLWFAGEAYSMRYYGYLHGAWLNGKEVAQHISQCYHSDQCPSYHYHPLVTSCYADTQQHRRSLMQSRSLPNPSSHPYQSHFSIH
ncbi:amine oxidase [Hesseltinella vesiculosa]|uniref:Amine oxidase n=1 Tax=Hesseltinella vesiculosa TaxID=101127 RepID=A0A1X2GAJ4_9FUNG|nr:amine oxidase [Hesseltinella vesiculosa]